MSWARMNYEERLRFVLGEAIMRLIADEGDWPTRRAELDTVRAVLCERLDDEEVMIVFSGTGWDIADMLEPPGDPDQFVLEFSPPQGCSDDDVPF